jgi:hypothetical protein
MRVEIIKGRVIVELAEKVDGVVGAFEQPVIWNDLYTSDSIKQSETY